MATSKKPKRRASGNVQHWNWKLELTGVEVTITIREAGSAATLAQIARALEKALGEARRFTGPASALGPVKRK